MEETSPEAATPELEEPDRKPTFSCRECGGDIEFQPGTDQLICPYCGAENEIEKGEEPIVELDFESYLSQAAADAPTEERITLECPACSAETTFEANVTSRHCPYCGTHLEGGGKSTKIIRPGSLLPFSIAGKEAARLFRKWLQGLWFAPSKLKRFAEIGGLDGVYIPYWTYDCSTHTEYRGEHGTHYWVDESYSATENGRRVTKTRRVRRTRWRPAAGAVSGHFDDVLVLASRSLPQDRADQLEPWDLAQLVPYDERYLRGFRAESYAVDLGSGFAVARQKMEPEIQRSVRRDIGGDEQRIHSMRTQHTAVTFKHVLLPVWIAAYHYQGKLYRFLVNARTGEVQGERPYSAIKIALAAAAAILLVGLMIYLGR